MNLDKMDQRTRRLMTMHKAPHPGDDVDRVYVSRKEGVRGLASTEDSVDASIQRFEGGARGVMVIVVGNGHGDTSSNPERD